MNTPTNSFTFGAEIYTRYVALKGAEPRKAGRAWLKSQGVPSTMADGLSMIEINAAWLDMSGRVLADLKSDILPSGDALAMAKAAQTDLEPAQANETAAELMLKALNLIQPASAKLDETRVLELIAEHAPKPEPIIKGYEFRSGEVTLKTSGRQHSYFPLIVAALSARQHVWLVGPAGGGKTTVVSKAAETLGLQHRAISVCAQSTKTDLLGFIDAHGVYRGTAFREAFEHGHVFLLDEADNGNANVLAVLNAALANGEMTFPDKTVQRHPDFVTVACANTFGNGATAAYVGRNQLDAATLDRFFFISMPYDEGLEASLVGIQGVPSPEFNLEAGGQTTTEAWYAIVQTARTAANVNGIKTVISPRATFGGAKLAALGVGLGWLKAGFLVKALDANSAARLF